MHAVGERNAAHALGHLVVLSKSHASCGTARTNALAGELAGHDAAEAVRHNDNVGGGSLWACDGMCGGGCAHRVDVVVPDVQAVLNRIAAAADWRLQRVSQRAVLAARTPPASLSLVLSSRSA